MTTRPFQPLVADRAVVAEVVERALGRRQHFDVEALIEGARPELGPHEGVGDSVVEPVGVLRRRLLLDAEDGGEGVVQPQPGRRAAEQREVGGEQAPDRARVLFDRAAVEPRHADGLGRNPLAVEHPVHVMIGDDEQPRRIGEGPVLGEPGADRCDRAD